MIKAINYFFKTINDWGDYTQRKFVENASQLYYWPQLFLVLTVFGIPWLYIWNAHHIGVWLDAVLGTGPHDPTPWAKVMWRRTLSSTLCAPFIAYALIRFAINRYKLRSDSKGSK